MSKLREEYDRIYTETEALIAQLETFASKGELSDADKATMKELSDTNAKRFARMEDIRKVLDGQKALAGLAFDKGNANRGTPPPGQEQTHKERGQVSREDLERGGALEFARTGNVTTREFSVVITTTGNSILLPASVATPVLPTLDHVLIRGLAEFGMTPTLDDSTGVLKVPVPDITAGGAITQSATTYTPGTESYAGSFVLTPAPYGSGVFWYSNAALNAPGYDLQSEILRVLTYQQVLGEESADLTALRTNATLLAAATATATATTLNYANLMAWNESVPDAWQRAGQFNVVSNAAYSAILGLTATDGNRLIVVDQNGILRLNGRATHKTSYLDALTADKVVGVTLSAMAFKKRHSRQYRLSRYTEAARRDQTGFELVRDHSFAFTTRGVALLKTPP